MPAMATSDRAIIWIGMLPSMRNHLDKASAAQAWTGSPSHREPAFPRTLQTYSPGSTPASGSDHYRLTATTSGLSLALRLCTTNALAGVEALPFLARWGISAGIMPASPGLRTFDP